MRVVPSSLGYNTPPLCIVRQNVDAVVVVAQRLELAADIVQRSIADPAAVVHRSDTTMSDEYKARHERAQAMALGSTKTNEGRDKGRGRGNNWARGRAVPSLTNEGRGLGHGKGYGLRNNQGGGRERGHGRGRARGQGCGRGRDQNVVSQGQEVVSLGVMEENNLPERSIFQYSDDLQKRCADIDDLLMELKSTEECWSVTTHNIF